MTTINEIVPTVELVSDIERAMKPTVVDLDLPVRLVDSLMLSSKSAHAAVTRGLTANLEATRGLADDLRAKYHAEALGTELVVRADNLAARIVFTEVRKAKPKLFERKQKQVVVSSWV